MSEEIESALRSLNSLRESVLVFDSVVVSESFAAKLEKEHPAPEVHEEEKGLSFYKVIAGIRFRTSAFIQEGSMLFCSGDNVIAVGTQEDDLFVVRRVTLGPLVLEKNILPFTKKEDGPDDFPF